MAMSRFLVAMNSGPPLLQRLSAHCVSRTISKRMLSLEPYALEGFLTLCSFWAAYVLFTPPSNFAAFPKAFAFVEQMQGKESLWATMVLVGAASKAIGLALVAVPPAGGVSFILRCVGLMISGFFWTVIGISSMLGNPDTLMGFPGFLMGLSAVWVLLRFPVNPAER